MAAGKSNKGPWAEQMDNLPIQAGLSFDRDAAWEKLHHRLYGRKEKRRGFAWAWRTTVSVAASVALLLFLSGKITKKQMKPGVVSGPEIKSNVPGEKKEQELYLKKAGDNALIDKNNTTYKNTDKKGQLQNKESIQTPETNTYTVISPAMATDTDTLSSSTVMIAVQPVIAKKKLKVVHNNELTGALSPMPIAEENTVAKNPGRFFPGFRKPVFNDNEDYSDDTVNRIKPKRSILPFSSLISQKE